MGTEKRGFASMSPERRREIASKGGKAAQAPGGGGHKFTSEEARAAGKIGGKRVHELKKAHRFTSEEASLAAKQRGKGKKEKVNTDSP